MDVKNRHAALSPLSHVIEDVKRYVQYCNHAVEVDLDLFLEKIKNLVISRGVQYLLIHLPDIGKEYDSGLSSGHYDTSSLPRDMGGSIPDRNWIFTSLLMGTFTSTGRLREDVDVNIVFFTRQILYMYKKIKLDCPTKAIKSAVDEFVDIEKNLRDPVGSWSDDKWQPNRLTFSGSECLNDTHPRNEKLWNMVDSVFQRCVPLVEVDPFEVSVRHGPGAVSDLKTGRDKYLFPNWPSKLDGTFPESYYSTHREPFEISFANTISDLRNTIKFPTVTRAICEEIIVEDSLSDGYRVDIPKDEPPAKLLQVPKTFKGPRLIASEPTAHQFFQQGLMSWLRKNLPQPLRQTIQFTSQEPSREAALLASKDGLSSTVDLSSASDRLSCWVVERAFTYNQSLLSAFHAVRTRHLIDGTGTYENLNLRLRKFAAQGSAITFPVQSIIYAGLSIAALLFVENKAVTKRSFAWAAKRIQVFGDDIIIPNEAVPVLASMLHSLQLKVNSHKTHTSGRFRESCGMDAFQGYDVTPCYLTTWSLGARPSDVQSWVDVSNNSHKKGLWNLSSWMTHQLPHKLRRKMIICKDEGRGCRLFTFQYGFVVETPLKWNEELHFNQTKVIDFRSKVDVERRRSWQSLYQYLIEAPHPETNWVSGYLTKKAEQFVQTWVEVPEGMCVHNASESLWR